MKISTITFKSQLVFNNRIFLFDTRLFYSIEFLSWSDFNLPAVDLNN